MNHQEIKEKIPLLISGELKESEKVIVEKHIVNCEMCKLEYDEFLEMEKVFENVSFKDPDDKLMEEYWSGIYNKLEKNTGVVFASIGAALLLFLGAMCFFRDFLFNSLEPLSLRIGAAILIAGVVILIVSVVREQYFYYKNERYKEVNR